jgi:hypothetical protein
MKNRFKNIKKNIVILIVLAIVIVIAGIGFFVATENQINDQEVQIAGLKKIIKGYDQELISLTKKNASESAQSKSLLDQPTPTIIYYLKNTPTPTNTHLPSNCTCITNSCTCPGIEAQGCTLGNPGCSLPVIPTQTIQQQLDEINSKLRQIKSNQ